MHKEVIGETVHLLCERSVVKAVREPNAEVGERLTAHDRRMDARLIKSPFGRVAHAVT
jgi:hypothetical protein